MGPSEVKRRKENKDEANTFACGHNSYERGTEGQRDGGSDLCFRN